MKKKKKNFVKKIILHNKAIQNHWNENIYLNICLYLKENKKIHINQTYNWTGLRKHI